MKANKIIAVALAALTLVSFASCDKKDKDESKDSQTALALNPTSAQLEVGKTVTITATVGATWSSSNTAVATVAVGNDGGKSAIVTAIAEGSAVISATANGQTKTCVVAVKKQGGGGGAGQLKGTQVWPIILDGTTAAANASKIVASFQPNDVDQFLYVWENTYSGGQATGLNFHGNSDGYTALVVGGAGWSGAGFFLGEASQGITAAKSLREAIIANPDQYFLHMAIKSTDNYSHCFYFMGAENTGSKFVIGNHSVYDGPVYQDFARDGAWHEFDIPMSAYATALSQAAIGADVNVFVVLTEGTQGAQLNLDAVYFYKN